MYSFRFITSLVVLSATAFSGHAELALLKIADSSTAVPGAPGTTFKDIGQPFLHNGQVLFYAANSADAPGLYLYNGSSIVKIADTNTPSPGGGNFTNVSFFAYGLENGTAAFVASETTGPALFRWANGVTTRLFKTGDAIPGTATNKFNTFGQPSFDNGTIYFIGADADKYRGIHRFDTVLSTGLVSSLHIYPGSPLPHGFSSQLSAESNRFAAWSFASNNQPNALFAWINGVKSFLVSSNDAIPPGGPNYSTFQSPPDLKDGVVAFKGGSVANFQEGIFLRPISGGPITPVVRRDDPNVGLAGTLTSFNEFATENNKVWFHAGGSSGESLFLWQNNSYSRVLSGGMSLSGRPLASSGAFTFTQNCYDHDQAAFVGRFFDNTKALYLTTNLPAAGGTVNSAFSTFAPTSTPLPGGTGFFTSTFGAFLWQGGMVFNGNGTNNQGGLYRYLDGAFSVLINKTNFYPGSTDTISSSIVLASDATRLLVSAGGMGGQQGLFIYEGGNLTRVADLTTAIPGGNFGNIGSFTRAQFNGSRLTFLATGTNNYAGLFEFNAGSLTRLLDTTSPFPGGASSLRITDFTQVGDLLGLVAFDGAGASLQGLMTYTNGTFSLIATNGAVIPGRPNRKYGFFTGLGFNGGKLYFTAQANSTVDFFSGTYLMQAPIGSVTPTIVVDENTYLPGLIGGANSLTLFSEPSGVFLSAANYAQFGTYHVTGNSIERLLDNNSLVNGLSVSVLNPTAGSLSTNGAAFIVNTSVGSRLLFSAPASATNPGGQFTPGSIVYSPGGPFCVTFAGATSGNSYRLQYNSSPGTTNWITFTNFTYTAPITICDPGATNQVRIYRAVSP